MPSMLSRWFDRFSRSRAEPSAPAVARAAAAEERTGSAVPRDILRQVRLIELRTRGLVDSIFGGEYQSVFRGQGMEFSDVREYQPGDDVRNIDWNVTARVGHPYIKKHVEERELTVMLLVDLSGSEQYGTRERFKAERAAEIAAVLALSAVRNNDRVGLLIFTDRIEHVVAPRKGRRHVLRLIRDVLAFQPTGRGTDLSGAVDYAARLLHHRAVIFLLSDFALLYPPDNGPESASFARWEKSLRLVSRRHDVVAVRVYDPSEQGLNGLGVISLRDPETGEELAVDTDRVEVRTRYEQFLAQEQAAMRRLFRRLGVDEIEIRTDGSFVTPLLSFFRRRERGRRRA